MGSRALVRWLLSGVLLLAVVVGLVVLVRDDGAGAVAPAPVPDGSAQPWSARQAGRAFLDGYVDPDGRVVRRDQDGDTVSEGQAYAMLVAAALDDRGTFDRVWGWARDHLSRPDGTLSWRWQDGRVVDDASAADADLDAARALVVAGRRWEDPALTSAGSTLGTAVLDVETVPTGLGRVLTAGSWATQDPWAVNPSYASPAAVRVLAAAAPDPRWAELDAGSRAMLAVLLDAAALPPDWAQVHGSGRVEATSGAAGRGGEGVRYSYDATRMPLRYAESCDPADVALAARLAGPLSRTSGHEAVRDLGGTPLGDVPSVVAAAAEAAAAAAAGDADRARAQLAAADQLQQQSPTYYGGAWDALGRLLLTDPVLGGCPPLEG
ncbi:endoglucanase [Friedmanniella luteola]|uniref:Endoglucanase n=1 Tax=Friedmanniella luteola TaxID=546871 RepID=A0A1H1SRX2_9ACTN|nr:glycosyl hydrolase family 8 [Friedmanniella luteola]SDS50760.1 endoglucanase [Friedmanniella luteola]